MPPALTRRRALGLPLAAAGLALWPLKAAVAQATRWHGKALGAAAELVFYHEDGEQADRLVARIAAETARLEAIFSLYRQDSALSTLNRQGALAMPPPELVEVLEIASTVWQLTDGAFDPTIQPLWRAYADHFAVEGADPDGPSAQEIDAALALVGLDQVSFNTTRIAFTRPGMALTLNGIAQGYITDRVTQILAAGGVNSALADIGEVRALGSRPDGTPWRVQIKGGQTVDLAARALATSSASGFRFAGPNSPSHILDPRSGMAPSLHETVSVFAPKAAFADALATAFCLMPRPEIDALLATLPEIDVLIS